MTGKATHLPFFVYGTLMKGEPNFERIFTENKIPVEVRDGFIGNHTLVVPPRAYFPYLVRDEDIPDAFESMLEQAAITVRGHVLDVPKKFFEDVLRVLDRLEGVPVHYEREVVDVFPERNGLGVKGKPTKAYVYVMPKNNVHHLFHNPFINSGSWKDYLQSRNSKKD